jgi:ergothioneine biosynthesis protein EgtB
MPPYDPRWGFLFNSYYEAVGPRHARPRRGMLSRPSCAEIAAYRAAIDGRVVELLAAGLSVAERAIVELGINHEEQHQELILTDLLHALSDNPLRPAYRASAASAANETTATSATTASLASSGAPSARHSAGARPAAPDGSLSWRAFDGGMLELGAGPDGFAFDNERPRHRVWLEPFELASRCVTAGEVRAFIADGGYRTASLWLSDGWDAVQQHGWHAPGYWHDDGHAFGLDGLRPLADDEPAAFVSYYEADAIARWLGARLPTEAEWERAAPPRTTPLADPATSALRPGDVWEWTASSYEAYPGYAPAAGALGEYNGKFMVNQRVLRGGSCFTPVGHVRPTYRNFWPPDTRFQVTGLRLARR